MNYQQLLEAKRSIVHPVGFDATPDSINALLFSFQRDITRWALRKGRAAIFADTGLGKTFMLLEWARLMAQHTGKPVLIVAPLSVARQTTREALKLGTTVTYLRSMDGVTNDNRLYITNYEMVEHFDAERFGAVVLDESSILKNLDGKLRRALTEMFADTPYRLCCTATPAPNDITEIGRHAEFLGIMSNAEMLAAFFINDMKQKDGVYRLKRHAVKPFYRWLASWGFAIKKPSDLGYSDEGYTLPGVEVEVVTTNSDYTPEGMLAGFFVGDISASDAHKVRRATMPERIAQIAARVNGDSDQWVIWTGLNDEAEALTAIIPGAVNIHGGLSPDAKADGIEAFVTGKTRVLVTKTSIAGFGINMQNCHKMLFCGIDYSWESYYQAVRRCYRFGQPEVVQVVVVTSTQERPIFDVVMRKEAEAVAMTDELIRHAVQYERDELSGKYSQDWVYQTRDLMTDQWHLMLGDSVERILELDENSVDLSVYSPPFISLYTYTPTERDMGNSRNSDEFFAQYRYIIDGLLRATKPGRNTCVHVQQVGATKSKDGYIGIKDFRGDVIRAYIEAGWIFHGEVTIDKNPQVQAIRTKTKGLMFQQLHKDSVANRPAFADYILIFQKPGENAVPVIPEVTNEEWILWAHPVWYDIRESDTLNVAVARSEEDERHMCPLQLPVIERCVRLYSNRGEVVFSPFAGIGSELVSAVKLGRKAIGIELKEEYFNVAARYLADAEENAAMGDLFSYAGIEADAEVEVAT
jgi:DNA modification methylase